MVFFIDCNGGIGKIDRIIVPVFRKLVRVEGTLDEVLTRAHFENWKDTYVEVKVQLTGPQIGVGDHIRQAFSNSGGRVLIVEPVLPGSKERESISTEDIKSESPDEIFRNFYIDRFGETGEALDEVLDTFRELLKLSEEAES